MTQPAVDILGLNKGSPKGSDYYPAVDVFDTTESTVGSTKKYLLADLFLFILHAGGFVTLPATSAASTTFYTATYNNGVGGINATLTDSTGFGPFVIDGVTGVPSTFTTPTPYLIKNQLNPIENGIYILIRQGDGVSIPWQLMRANYFNSNTNILDGEVTMVTGGVTLANTAWEVIVTNPVNVGTDPINFALFQFLSSIVTLPLQPQFGGTGVANPPSSTITLGGSLDIVSAFFPTVFNITGATNVTFPTSGTLATTSQLASLSQTIYVDPNGSDIVGTGTVNLPFQTYEKARTVAIATASITTPFNIIMNAGIYNIAGNMTLSPFVNITGRNDNASQFIITGQVILDPSFDTTATPTCFVSDVSISAAGNVSLSFLAFQNAIIHFDNIDFSGTPNFIATGAGLNVSTELVILDNCISVIASPVFTFTNIFAAIANTVAGNGITSINNSAVSNNILILIDLYGPTSPVIVRTTGAGSLTTIVDSVYNFGSTFTIDGPNNNVIFDASSYMVAPTYLNGATAANVTLASLSDGIEANTNFTPVNYTPTAGVDFKANSVTGNLAGIDSAIGGIVAGQPLTEFDDTNVTMTLGGTPATALLQAVSMTLGWTGQLALSRGGSNADLSLAVSNGGIVWTNATQMQILAGTATASKMLLSGSSASPSWSTSTIPTSAGAIVGKVLSSDGTNYVLSSVSFPTTSATAGKIIISDGSNWISSTSIWPNTVGVAGKIVISDGTSNVYSTPTYPNASVTAGKLIISDGTNYIASTSIWPNTVGSAGKIIRSDGTSNLYTTATFADTYAASDLLYSNGANTVTGLATVNSSVLTTNSTGVPTWVGPLLNGQLIIGSTGANPTAATLSAGPGVSIANGAGTITISGTGSGIGWTEVLASQSMTPDSGYITNSAGLITLTLPVIAAIGTAISIVGKGAGGWKIAQNGGQNVQVGNVSSTIGAGGSVASSNQFDSVSLICTTANTTWTVLSGPQGNLTIV